MNDLLNLRHLRHAALAAAVASVSLAGFGCDSDNDLDDGDIDVDTAFGLTSPVAMDNHAAAHEGELLTITKQFPENVQLGSSFTYTIDVANASDGDLSNVVVMEEIPETFELRSSEPEGQMKDGRLTFKMDGMAAGDSAQIQVTGVAREAGSLELCTTYDVQQGICSVVEIANPSLTIRRTAPEVASVCQLAEVTYVVTNDGTTAAEDVTLFESVGDGMVGGEQGGEMGTEVSIELGDIPAGESVERTILIAAERPLTYENYAVAEGELSKVESSTGATRFVAPELDVQVRPERDVQFIGRTARFEIVVANNGEGDSLNTGMGLGFEGGEIERFGTGGQEIEAAAGSYALGSIAAGESRRFYVDVLAEAEGELVAAAAVKAMCERIEMVLAEDAAEARVRIQPVIALQVETIDSVDPVQVGGETVYEIAVLNEGTGTETNLQVSGELPEGFSFVSADGDTAGSNDGNTVTFEPLAELGAGQVATFYITAKADQAAGSTQFRLTVNSDNLDEAVVETEPTRSY